MTTAWVRVDALDALPGVCVKTGAPTEVRLPLKAEYVPAALRWLQLYGMYQFVFAHTAAKRRRVVRLPVSRAAFRRYRAWQLSTVAFVIAGVAAGLAGSLTARPVLQVVGYAVAAAAFLVGARAHNRYWIAVNIDRRGRELTISRCHPEFARAAGRVAAGSRR